MMTYTQMQGRQVEIPDTLIVHGSIESGIMVHTMRGQGYSINMVTEGYNSVEFTVGASDSGIYSGATIATIIVGSPTIRYCKVVGQYTHSAVTGGYGSSVTILNTGDSYAGDPTGLYIYVQGDTIMITMNSTSGPFSFNGIFKVEVMIK